MKMLNEAAVQPSNLSKSNINQIKVLVLQTEEEAKHLKKRLLFNILKYPVKFVNVIEYVLLSILYNYLAKNIRKKRENRVVMMKRTKLQ